MRGNQCGFLGSKFVIKQECDRDHDEPQKPIRIEENKLSHVFSLIGITIPIIQMQRLMDMETIQTVGAKFVCR